MFKRITNKFFRVIFLIYISIIPKKIRFDNLENLNFRKVDFTNYKKIKLLIFNNNFIQNEKEPSIYNFDFLNYSIKIGGKKGIKIAKRNIIEWQKINRFKIKKFWESEVIANRILNLIYNFEYINSLSSKAEENKLKKIIQIHINRFNFEFYLKKNEDLSLLEFKTYVLTSIITDKKNLNYEKIFIKIILNQLDNLSMHKSYNLLEHSKSINHISEIINIFLSYKIKIPHIFYITKLKMVTVFSQYFHKDDSVPLFNGTHNNYLKEMITVLKEESNIRKIEYPNDTNGIFFFGDKNKKIFFDLVQPSRSFLSKKLSASTLSIEFSSNKEKIITNCGALEKLGGNASYLRYTAAHSALSLKNTNISEIREEQPHLKFPQLVDVKKSQNDKWIECEGSHNGYIKNYKKIIKRKILFREDEESLYGEDHIISSIPKNQEVLFHIRFHIMPNINITETNKKRGIILKTKNDFIWTFKASADLVLEESIFVDNSNTAKTNQIVIKGITKNNREIIKWSLIKT